MELRQKLNSLESNMQKFALNQAKIMAQLEIKFEVLDDLKNDVKEIKKKVFENGISKKVEQNANELSPLIEIKDDLIESVKDYKERKKDAIIGKWIIRIAIAVLAFGQVASVLGIENIKKILTVYFGGN